MNDIVYVEMLRSQLGRHRPTRTHDRDVARLLSPWRRHHTRRGGAGTVG